MLNEGRDLVEVLRHLEVSESTWNRWRHRYGGMDVSQAKRRYRQMLWIGHG